MADTSTRIEKAKTPDLPKFIEEIRALKARLQSLELARLEEARQVAVEASGRDASRRAKGVSPDELLRLQQEARRYVDAEHENSKAILISKYESFEANLGAFAQLFHDLLPLRDQKGQLAREAERLKKIEEELGVRRNVIQRTEEELEREKALLQAAEVTIAKKEEQLNGKLADLDVVRRAQNLDGEKRDLDSKLKAYEGEAQSVVRDREVLNRDFDKLGEKRAELDREVETLRKGREKLDGERRKMVEVVAKEVAATFKTFIRDLLRPPAT